MSSWVLQLSASVGRATWGLLALLLAVSGCGSLVARSERKANPDGDFSKVYGGVQYDWQFIAHPTANSRALGAPAALGFLGTIEGLVDLGPSLVLDTLLLPFDLTWKPTPLPDEEASPH